MERESQLHPGEVLDGRKHSKFMLTREFAVRVREVTANFAPDTPINKLYLASHTSPNTSAGEEWYLFLKGLTKDEKAALTRSLVGPAYRKNNEGNPLTISDVRNIQSDDLVGWKVRPVTADFIALAFSLPPKEENILEV